MSGNTRIDWPKSKSAQAKSAYYNLTYAEFRTLYVSSVKARRWVHFCLAAYTSPSSTWEQDHSVVSLVKYLKSKKLAENLSTERREPDSPRYQTPPDSPEASDDDDLDALVKEIGALTIKVLNRRQQRKN